MLRWNILAMSNSYFTTTLSPGRDRPIFRDPCPPPVEFDQDFDFFASFKFHRTQPLCSITELLRLAVSHIHYNVLMIVFIFDCVYSGHISAYQLRVIISNWTLPCRIWISVVPPSMGSDSDFLLNV